MSHIQVDTVFTKINAPVTPAAIKNKMHLLMYLKPYLIKVCNMEVEIM